MTDLHALAEAARQATPEQLSAFRAYAPRPAAPELRPIPDPKPSTTVENVSLAIGLATVAGVLAGALT